METMGIIGCMGTIGTMGIMGNLINTVSAQIERRRSINFLDFKLPLYLNLNKVLF